MREETRLNFRPDLCAASTRQARTWCKLRTLMLSLLFCSAFSINRGNARGEKIASVYGRVDKLEEIERETERERGIKKKKELVRKCRSIRSWRMVSLYDSIVISNQIELLYYRIRDRRFFINSFHGIQVCRSIDV